MSKKNKADNRGFVYSTDPSFKFEEEERPVVTLAPVDQKLLDGLLPLCCNSKFLTRFILKKSFNTSSA